MASIEYITRNDTAAFVLEFENSDGSPMDLSWDTVRLIVKKDRQAPDSSAALKAEWIHPAGCRLFHEFTPEETAALAEGEYWGAVKKYSDAQGVQRAFEVAGFRLIVNKGVFNG
ncbi:MAG: hypothetical protein LBO78_01975 [Rickettsiales bacterium]|jgi:hypothetical protein|nr:hypothetical protein [Rickettsiales bacterium]